MKKIVMRRTNQRPLLFAVLAFTMLSGFSCYKVAKMVFKPKNNDSNVSSRANEVTSGDNTRNETTNTGVDDEVLTESAKSYLADGKKLLGREDHQGAVKSFSRAIKKTQK